MADRSAIADSLVLDCLRRRANDPVVPMIFILGRRGSGKTSLVTHVQNRLASSVEMPYVLIDCAASQQLTVWRLICEITNGLNKKWTEFGRLRFPRTTLGRLAAEHGQLPIDQQEAKQRLLAALWVATKLPQHAKTVDQIVVNVAEVMNASPGVGNLLRQVLRMVARSRVLVQRAYKIGLKYFGDRQGGGDDLSPLINLNKWYHSDDPRAAHVLCRAFLDDLIDEYHRRSHGYNCTVLLDNCEGQCAVNFLNLMTELRCPIDPLLLIATSRLVPQVTGLDSLWSLPWERETNSLPRMPTTSEVDYKSWQGKGKSRKDPASWWYPVCLDDLSWTEVRDIVDYRHVGFIYRLTRGHLWGTRRLAEILPVGDIDRPFNHAELDDFLLREAPTYLLEDLGKARPILVRWSAAQSIDTARQALGHGRHPNLDEEVVNRFWVVPGRRRHELRLHPWLRRMLLYELAMSADWKDTHKKLRQYCDKCKWSMEVAYHSLALDDPKPAVDYLLSALNTLDADHWINEFNEITSAPRLLARGQKAAEQYETMIQERGDDILVNVILSMVAARSIWSDPLGDPTYSLKDTIADGYARLAEMATAGSVEYRRKAKYYRNLDARSHRG
jgi:hypothetical protein